MTSRKLKCVVASATPVPEAADSKQVGIYLHELHGCRTPLVKVGVGRSPGEVGARSRLPVNLILAAICLVSYARICKGQSFKKGFTLAPTFTCRARVKVSLAALSCLRWLVHHMEGHVSGLEDHCCCGCAPLVPYRLRLQTQPQQCCGGASRVMI